MGILLVYSVTDRNSFTNIDNWIKQIKERAPDHVSLILVANKIDVPEKAVESSEGKKLAEQYDIPFFETSAKENVNINETFIELGKQIKTKIEQFGLIASVLPKPKQSPIKPKEDNKSNCKC